MKLRRFQMESYVVKRLQDMAVSLSVSVGTQFGIMDPDGEQQKQMDAADIPFLGFAIGRGVSWGRLWKLRLHRRPADKGQTRFRISDTNYKRVYKVDDVIPKGVLNHITLGCPKKKEVINRG